MVALDLTAYSLIKLCGCFLFQVFCFLITHRASCFEGQESSSAPSGQGFKFYCYKNAGCRGEWMDGWMDRTYKHL